MEPYQELEQKFGSWLGWKPSNVVACSSGTAALHLALESLGLPLGSEVIVPEFTMIACARACVLAGLKPVFVDCGEDLLMRPDLLEHTITSDTSAIMPVHIYGRLCNMEAICRIANRRNLAVIEDSAESHGAKHKWVSDAVCWSFYKNKIVAGEEGGAVAFLRDDCAAKARQLRSLGFTDAHDFMHVPRGHNYRLSNLHAKAILESLAHVEENLAKRRQVEQWYNEQIPIEIQMPKRDVPWVYDVNIKAVKQLTPMDLTRLVKSLNDKGIAARHAFRPMSEQPEFGTGYSGFRRLLAYKVSRELIYLPIRPNMSHEEVASNCKSLPMS